MSDSGDSHDIFPNVNSVHGVTAGETPSGESHETFSKPPEGLTPEGEQGAGSREQGGGAREARPRPEVTLLGNALLDEHRRLTRPSLPRDVARKTGEQIEKLLGDPVIQPDEIRAGLAKLRAKPKLGPGLLPDLVHEVRQERAHPEMAAKSAPPRRSGMRGGGAADPLTDQIYGQGMTTI
jgi:hypothetical protein